MWNRSSTIAFALTLLGLVAPAAFAEWPAFGRPLSTELGDQLGPVIAPDRADGAIVAWSDRRIIPFNLRAQHVRADGVVDVAWPLNGRALLTDSLARTIVTQGVESPAIASDGAGGAIVTWPDARSSVNGEDIYALHVRANGT